MAKNELNLMMNSLIQTMMINVDATPRMNSMSVRGFKIFCYIEPYRLIGQAVWKGLAHASII